MDDQQLFELLEVQPNDHPKNRKFIEFCEAHVNDPSLCDVCDQTHPKGEHLPHTYKSARFFLNEQQCQEFFEAHAKYEDLRDQAHAKGEHYVEVDMPESFRAVRSSLNFISIYFDETYKENFANVVRNHLVRVESNLGILAKAVVAVLEKEKHPASDAVAVRELTNAIQGHMCIVRDACGFDASMETGKPLFENGILHADERFANYLERLGEEARGVAEDVRINSRKRFDDFGETLSFGLWGLWYDPIENVPRFIRGLGFALWRTSIRERVKRLTSPAAITAAVASPLLTFFGQATARGHARDQFVLPIDKDGEIILRLVQSDVATFPEETLNLVSRGHSCWSGITARKLLRWEVTMGHHRCMTGVPDARALRIEGGFQGLAFDHLKLTAKADVEMVRAAIEFQHGTELRLPDGSFTRLIIRTIYPSRPGRRASLEIVLGTAILPNFTYEIGAKMPKGLARSEARKLIPVPPEPPPVGQRNDYAALDALSWLLMVFFRDRASELATRNCVLIEPRAWEQMAARAGVRTPMARVIERWLTDGDDGPAMLKLVDRDRYTLGDAHASIREFLMEGGRMELGRSIQGKKGNQIKRSRVVMALKSRK
jgi:hypothetical protein